MSRDCQHRPRRRAESATALVAAKLTRMGRRLPSGWAILACPLCDSERGLRFEADLISGEHHVHCLDCDISTLRAYYDPLDAVLFWNALASHLAPEERAACA